VGGADPPLYFAKHPNRFPLLHLKDMARDGRMANVGQGTIDFAKIFVQALRAGVRHLFVEHDNPAHPLLDADASYRYLRERLKA
jgi:sugar phosphate isomerase/epimerase